MGQTADQLRQEIDAKRNDASDKIGQIEEKVTGVAEQAKETVTGVAEQAKETVMNTFDWRRQVDQKPLVALGAAFVGGMILAGAVGDKDEGSHRSSSQSNNSDFNIRRYSEQSAAAAGGMGIAGAIRTAAKNSGLEDMMNNMTGSFMSNITDRIKQMADQAFPGMAEKLQAGNSQKSDGSSSKNTNWSQPSRQMTGSTTYGSSTTGTSFGTSGLAGEPAVTTTD